MSKSSGPAFPGKPIQFAKPGAPVDEVEYRFMGLTKREFIATMAMQGMMTLPPPDQLRWSGVAEKEFNTVAEWVASNCVAMADAMLTELEKEHE